MPTRKVSSLLRQVKERRDTLSTPGVYSIPCSCDKVYIGTTGRSIATRRKEHERYVRLKQYDESAIAEHIRSHPVHKIRFEDTKVLVPTKNYYSHMNREAIEIFKNPNNINREDGLILNRVWKTVIRTTTHDIGSPREPIQTHAERLRARHWRTTHPNKYEQLRTTLAHHVNQYKRTQSGYGHVIGAPRTPIEKRVEQ
ncbi:hypothetical protein QE152_g21784 [Popillia japonica]|uniref:GIY-YIG domain-containing protein n=1 Tax=Popillia japonica TaxID=7064 RepID=A0AAW1KKZ8_POPJA